MESELLHTDRGHTHVASLRVEGEEAARVNTLDYQMRVGRARVRMGGIAGVATGEKYRLRGYASKLMSASLDYMKDAGFDYTVLFGIRDFYHRFDYAPIFGWHRLEIAANEAARCEPGLQVRPAVETDATAIIDLFNATNSERTCSLVRLADWRTEGVKGLEWSTRAQYFVCEDAGEPVGAFAIDSQEDRLEVVELDAASGYRQTSVFSTMLAWLAQQAALRKVKNLGFHVPADHPFAHYARRLDCRGELSFTRTGEAMGRIVNLAALFGKLLPELSARLQRTRLEPQSAQSVKLICEPGEIILQASGENVRLLPAGAEAESTLRLPQKALAQLVVGYRDFSDLEPAEVLELTGNPAPLLQVIFPRRVGYIWRTNQF